MAKQKYSINWEDDIAVSFEVNGVEYESLDDIPDEKDRLKLEAMLNSAEDAEFDAEFEADFEKIRQEHEKIQNFPMEKVVLSVFAGVSILMLLIAAISSYNNIMKISREERVPGQVVEMVAVPEYSEDDTNRVIGEYHQPVVIFRSLDGKRYQVQLSEGSNPPSYEVGDEVTILYEPENPSDPRIQSAGSNALMWILPTITGILGLGFLVAVLAVQKYLMTDETTT